MAEDAVGQGVAVVVPHETVNDDTVTIQRWHFPSGAKVRKGDLVATIETSKAAIEVESTVAGYLQILKPEGSSVNVGETIARVAAAPVTEAAEAPPRIAAATARAGSQAVSAGASGPTIATFSRKARALIQENGLDEALFAGRGLVREADVLAYLDRGQAEPKVAAETADRVELNGNAGPWKKKGLLGDARASASDRGRSLLWLAWNYLWRTWFLNNLVPFAPRGVINRLHRLRGVRLGADCFIDPSAILETAYPGNITIGNDVRIAARATIMTHIKAPDYLRETGIMPVVLKPVVVHDHAFIGVGAIIMPGVSIGAASVISSGAVVFADVPAYVMVGGNPARVIKRFPLPEGTKSDE